jgi:hypothetical protein
MPALSLPRKIADAADATRCLDALAESGQSPSAWARAHRVNPRLLEVWRRRLQPDLAPRGPCVQLIELLPPRAGRPTPLPGSRRGRPC